MNLSIKSLANKVQSKMNTSLGQLIRLELITTAKFMLIEGESISSINSISYSTIFTQISLSSQKTFEIQHMAENTQLDDGFGIATGFGVNELYTRVVITVL